MTIQEAAKAAVQVQDACNLSGVAHSFLDAVKAVNEVTQGTYERNNHPIIRLFVYKLAALARMEPLDCWDRYSSAEQACQLLAGIDE